MSLGPLMGQVSEAQRQRIAASHLLLGWKRGPLASHQHSCLCEPCGSHSSQRLINQLPSGLDLEALPPFHSPSVWEGHGRVTAHCSTGSGASWLRCHGNPGLSAPVTCMRRAPSAPWAGRLCPKPGVTCGSLTQLDMGRGQGRHLHSPFPA